MTNPEPDLPTYTKVITVIDILLSAARSIFVLVILFQIASLPPTHQALSMLYVSLILNAGIIALGVGGGLSVLAHRRDGPYLQGGSMALVLGVWMLGAYLNLSLAHAQDRGGVFVGVAIMGILIMAWAAAVAVSIQKVISLFKFVDAPRRVTFDDISRLGTSVAFRALDLSGNSLVNDRFCGALANHRGIRQLVLSQTPITDGAIRKLAYLNRLESLDLSDTRVTDAIFPMLETSGLKWLNLSGTRCTAEGIAAFQEQRRNEHPNLADVQISLEPGDAPADDPIAATLGGVEPPVSNDADLNQFLSGLGDPAPEPPPRRRAP